MSKMHFYHILICLISIKQKYIVLSVGYGQLLHHFAGKKVSGGCRFARYWAWISHSETAG